MWNISHAIGGYKETRLWNVIPYGHTGFLMTYDRGDDAQNFSDREFAMGLGLLNNIRLCDRVDLTLDLRGILTGGRHHAATGGVAGAIQMTVGASVNLGKTNWTRAANWHNPSDVDALAAAAASAAALTAANAALADEKAELEKKNAELAQANDELQKALEDAKANAGLTEVGPAAFYFEIGKTTLSAKELEHLDFYLKNVLPNVGDKKVAVITGSADSKTGTVRRNKYLSQKRVDYVMNILAEKYGIEADRFQVRTQVANEGEAALNRAVIISFE
jgi:outer membrane protein OmpA-like peptidoglycan-associated protein